MCAIYIASSEPLPVMLPFRYLMFDCCLIIRPYPIRRALRHAAAYAVHCYLIHSFVSGHGSITNSSSPPPSSSASPPSSPPPPPPPPSSSSQFVSSFSFSSSSSFFFFRSFLLRSAPPPTALHFFLLFLLLSFFLPSTFDHCSTDVSSEPYLIRRALRDAAPHVLCIIALY